MTEMVGNCPRCGAKSITFDVLSTVPTGTEYRWRRWYEAFCQCRNCSRTTIFIIAMKSIDDEDFFATHSPMSVEGSLNPHFTIEGIINAKDGSASEPPEHVPPAIAAIFSEGAKCMVVQCWNAAGAMFRLCVDMSTEPLVPSDAAGLTPHVRKNLGPRLDWLIRNSLLPKELEGLSECIREDGNDAAHRGSLKKEDSLDLQDFTEALLERLYTEPQRLKLAEKRRTERRRPPSAKT